MKIFLTGATGFIGRQLTKVLVARGWEVTALVRRPEAAEARAVAALGARLVPGDVTRRESMREPMRGADAVVHNAGWYEFGITEAARAAMRAINVDGTENTLGLARELGIPRILHVSTILAFGPTGGDVADETFCRRKPPATCYEQTKTEAHEIALRLQREGAPVTVVCPAGVIGPGDHSSLGVFARLYVRGLMPPFVFAPDGSRAHIHVEDLAEGIALTVEKGRPGECYILSGGNLRHRETFALWTTTPGGFRTFVYLPRPLAWLMCAAAEPLERLMGWPLALSRELAVTAFENWDFSAAKAERELGARFRPVRQAWLDTLEAERKPAARV